MILFWAAASANGAPDQNREWTTGLEPTTLTLAR